MFKYLRIAALLLVAGFFLTACGGSEAPVAQNGATSSPTVQQVEQKENPTIPESLLGNWKNDDPNMHMSAVVANGTIEIVFESDTSSALYWKGTFPESATNGQDISSQGDTEALDASLMGSSETVKEFTYDDGNITYELTALGVTTRVVLAKS